MKDFNLFGYHIKITKRHKNKTKEVRLAKWVERQKKIEQGQSEAPQAVIEGKEGNDEQGTGQIHQQ